MKPDSWIAALTDVLGERRAELLSRHGDLDRLRAFAAGNLEADEADEVRELLALHPELAAALDETGEPPAYGPGHAAHLSTTEQEAGWRDLASRLGLEAGPVPVWRVPWRVVASVAAGLVAVAVTVTLVFPLGPGAPSEEIVLQPDPVTRGVISKAPATTMTSQADLLRLALELPRSTTSADRFRVVVYEVASKRDVWAEDGLTAVTGDRLSVRIPRPRLSSQVYRLEVQRARPDGSREPVASYSLRIP